MDMTYWIKGLLCMFYIVTPSEYQAENGSSAFKESLPFFMLFIALENIILYVKKKKLSRLNDSITSLSHGLFYASGRILSRGVENWLYYYIYDNYRILDLKWDTPLTWYCVAIMIDFCYYWVHRASHEIHILWAQHQVHHSSEDYNLAVGLRHSIFHTWCGVLLYLPMALAVPPVQYIIHQQFNLLYQFWIHTEVIRHLGPLEKIFNTPNHHRVHHGSNLIYLDKNYGGVLIIWDRLFGTFAEFTQNITYGLVYQPRTFNPLYQQFFYNQNVHMKCGNVNGWWNKVQSVIKGPSWTPGSKWTGNEENKLNIQDRGKFDPYLPPWCKVYLSIHFVLTVFVFHSIAAHSEVNHPLLTFLLLCYVLLSLTVIGMFFDNNCKAISMEIVRCLTVYIYIWYSGTNLTFMNYNTKVIYGLSAGFWILKYFRIIKLNTLELDITKDSKDC